MPSLEQLEKLLAADPGDAFLLYGLAQEYAKQGNLDRAVEFYDRCLGVDPAYCYAYYHKARALESAGKRDEAVGTLRAGFKQAQMVPDNHAAAELSALLDELT
jgi:tetratricopeptide (TPR) repeat protein